MAAHRLKEDRSDSETRVEKGKGCDGCDGDEEVGNRGGGGGVECADMQMRGGHPPVTNF